MKIDKTFVSEWLLGLAIVTALALLTNPFGIFMASALTLTLAMLLAVMIIAFGVFFWREQPRDEREAIYRQKAGHISYFVGAAILVAAIIVQVLAHDLDIWLAAALGGMVISKLIFSAWIRNK